MALSLKSLVCATLLITSGVEAQETGTVSGQDIVVGQQYMFQSDQLEREQVLQIALPANYDEAETQRYPVLYVLDGQWQFLEAVSFVRRLAGVREIPDVIVVGLPRTLGENQFYHAGSAGTDKMLDFIEQTAQPFVSNKFRTTGQDIVAGWAYTGGFALHALTTRPQLFDAFIMSSPFPIADYATDFENTSYQLVENFPDILEEDKFLYFGADVSERIVLEGARKLNDLLSQKAPSNLTWAYEELTGERHVTTAHRLLYSGLRSLFEDFGDLAFDSVEALNEFGGLEGVKNYYRKRAEKYDVSPRVVDSTVFRLARIAMDEENLELFDRLRANFDPYFSRARFSWSNRYAALYLKHNRHRVAVQMYERLVARFPSSVGAYAGLGEAYSLAGRSVQAIKMYERAVDLAKDKKDERLNELQEKLAALK